jgi:ribose 1,5-bisphosphokinase
MSKLFYIIGASGAGKDTLMNYARTQINGAAPVMFAHRYITRPPFAGSENHVYLTAEEFKMRIDAGCFALYWESHGQFYGIGCEIDTWLQKGFNVVINGSRQYLPVAQQLYPDLCVVLIDASPEIITQRLAMRGRETAAEIEKRIARTSEITTDLDNCVKIANNSEIREAGEAFINVISVAQKLYI